MGGRCGVRRDVGAPAVWLLALLMAAPAGAQIEIIDSPTAATLGHGNLRWDIGVGTQGSLLTGLRVGAFEQLHFGVSYGMLEVLGRGDVDPNPHPSINVRLLLIDQVGIPAVAIGFDGQGHGAWIEDLDRYERQSLGFYAVGTQFLQGRSWDVLTAITGGLNYSLEGASFDLFAGLSQTYGRHFSLLLDYDFNLDDHAEFDANRGYLDFGMQWRFGGGNHVRFLLRDLLGNYEGGGQVARELAFYYLFRL